MRSLWRVNTASRTRASRGTASFVVVCSFAEGIQKESTKGMYSFMNKNVVNKRMNKRLPNSSSSTLGVSAYNLRRWIFKVLYRVTESINFVKTASFCWHKTVYTKKKTSPTRFGFLL
uniref:Secreted protein n=1 Tax=Globodera rostochiensis TaxID=31243 RepID=A0A914HF33_GLORO